MQIVKKFSNTGEKEQKEDTIDLLSSLDLLKNEKFTSNEKGELFFLGRRLSILDDNVIGVPLELTRYMDISDVLTVDCIFIVPLKIIHFTHVGFVMNVEPLDIDACSVSYQVMEASGDVETGKEKEYLETLWAEVENRTDLHLYGDKESLHIPTAKFLYFNEDGKKSLKAKLHHLTIQKICEGVTIEDVLSQMDTTFLRLHRLTMEKMGYTEID